MDAYIEEKLLKPKVRKRKWIWYCDSCKKKMELDTGDIYYIACLRDDKDPESILAHSTCSEECAEIALAELIAFHDELKNGGGDFLMQRYEQALAAEFALNDDRLSWKAKGLFAYLVSTNGKVKVQDLIKSSQDGREAIRSGLQELERFGYLERRQQRKEDGSYSDAEYVIHPQPVVKSIE